MLINDASITGSLIVNASSSFQNIAVSGNILPGTNNVYNLGSIDKYFKEIFVSTGSIKFVDNTGVKTTITSVAGGGIQIGSVQITTSSIAFVDNTGSVTQTIAQSSSLGSTSNFTPTSSFNSYTQSISSSVASSITSSIATISSSVTTTITTLSSSVSTSFGLSAASVTSLSSSTSTSFSSSAASVTSLSSSISSSVTFLSSSLTSVNTTQNNRLSSIELVTGSYATTGSNTFFGTQTFSGSVFIANNLTVQGSSSIQYISASSVSIGTNIVQLNTANPAIRFAGLSIIDSGSVGGSGSFLYDSKEDEFLFVHRGNGINVTSSHFVMGPETFDNLGNEIYLTTNVLSKGTGKEHLVDSCIFDNGTTTCFYNSTTINSSGVLTSTNLVGTICARNGVISGSSQVDLTGTTNYASGILTRLNTVGVFSGSSQVDGTAITNKSITIAGTSTALGGTITLATMTGGSAIHSGSYLATATTANLSENTNLYYTDARVKTKLSAETVISGSGQVAIASTSGFGTYINQALLTTSSPTFNTVTAALTGNATTATTSTNLYGAGGSYIASSNGTKSYSTSIQIREAGLGGAQSSNMTYAPRLGFHWSGVVASSIAMEASGRIGIFNNPGTAYENFIAETIYANSSFQGNLTGNVTGNATNITAYTINQSVGTSNSPTFAGLTINTSGTGTWGPVVIQSTSCWGDGATQYATIGAGAAGIMIYNPHIVWNGGNTAAAFRMGRSGGISSGAYYEVGVGASDNFFIAKNALATGAQLNINSSGNATFSGDVTAYSDIRVKENIKTITDALSKVRALRGVTYNRIDTEDKSEKIGVIAQEVLQILPQIVTEENDRYSVAYGNMTALLVEAIKEQQIKIDNLTIEVENLKKPKGL